jgi:hypothetical protein
VIFACRRRLRGIEGEGGTSCRRLFPGRPGLSQSRFRRVFQPAALSTVLSRNEKEVEFRAGERKVFLIHNFFSAQTGE